MPKPASKLHDSRQTGKHQVDVQRTSILDAAEALFLQQGLDSTRMIDIAAAANITKITLYRYFPNRDEIALEIHARMMWRVISLIDPAELDFSTATARKMAQAMIRNFSSLRQAYRYMGMFDALYLDNPTDTGAPQHTKDWLANLLWHNKTIADLSADPEQDSRFLMILSTVIWFLEKLALRGELTWADQSIPIEQHLRLFEDMILGYIDSSS
jgi:AcrR family transcriptional regulator